jgi:GNAT superfamily N-acetyltransferase
MIDLKKKSTIIMGTNERLIEPVIYKEEQPDINSYMELFNTTGWNTEYKLSIDEMKKALNNSWYMVSAYSEDRLVGFGRVVTDGVIHAMIYEMIVLPESQRKGIGKQILKMLVGKCLQNNIRDIQLFCAKGKKEFYIRNGFVSRPYDAPGMQYVKK